MSNQELNSFFKQLTKNQKIGLAGLSVLTVLIFFMWFAHLKNGIVQPLYGGYNLNQIQTNTDLTGEQFEAQVAEAQKNTDSDEDGLSDWDESNLYSTSPYLQDSDSDGISDRDEVTAGTNPNCVEGEECLAGNIPVSTVDNTGDQNKATQVESIATENLSESEGQAIQEVFGENPSADAIRNILLQSGMTAEQLASYTDEQLIATFNSLQ